MYAYVDEVYSTGDGGNAWCSIDQPIASANVGFNGVAAEAECGTDSCFGLDTFNKFIFLMGGTYCLRNNTQSLNTNYQFICK
jgi:hypothetical protein